MTEITSSNPGGLRSRAERRRDTCQPLPFTLAQDESCTIDITFRPSRIDIIGGELSIVSDDPDVIDNPLVVTMLGMGVDEGQGSEKQPFRLLYCDRRLRQCLKRRRGMAEIIPRPIPAH